MVIAVVIVIVTTAICWPQSPLSSFSFSEALDDSHVFGPSVAKEQVVNSIQGANNGDDCGKYPTSDTNRDKFSLFP